jgi:hypothetical protein
LNLAGGATLQATRTWLEKAMARAKVFCRPRGRVADHAPHSCGIRPSQKGLRLPAIGCNVVRWVQPGGVVGARKAFWTLWCAR